MFRSTLLVAAAGFFTAAHAQLSNGLNYSTEGPLQIDTTEIEPALLATWCNAQRVSCPILCGGRATENTCEASSLEYTCECSDNSTPNISDYQQTVPFYVCDQWIANCVDNHPDDLTGQAGCRSVTCGSQNASEAETSTSSSGSNATTTSSSPDSTDTPSETTSSDSEASPTESPNAAIALHVAQNYGTGILFTAMVAVFGLVL